MSGAIKHRDHVGNAMADQAAKEATNAAETLALPAAFRKQLKRALLWPKWVLKYTFEWVADVEGDTEHEGKKRGATVGEGSVAVRVGGFKMLHHEFRSVRGKHICRRC